MHARKVAHLECDARAGAKREREREQKLEEG
jgi:hypothetical protein